MGFFRLQSKLVYPPSFPPDCLKSLGESWKVCTPIQGRQRIFNPHWGYFYFIRQSPPRMVSIGERSSPPENFGNVQNSGEIPDIIKRRKGLIYQSFWLFFCKRKKRFGGIFGDRCLWGRRSAPVAHDWWEKTYRPKRQSKITNLFFKDYLADCWTAEFRRKRLTSCRKCNFLLF